jgi:ComF family protein
MPEVEQRGERLPKQPPRLCGDCLRRAPAFDAAYAAFRYATPLDRLIRDLKYHRRLARARVLGRALAAHLRARGAAQADLVVPVPLHPTRLRERGYNQSLELARVLARELTLPLAAPRAVERRRATAPQAKLDPAQRRRNVRDAFRVHTEVRGLRVAIVDDVMTSGHTAGALARCLKRAGAAHVAVWVVARAG